MLKCDLAQEILNRGLDQIVVADHVVGVLADGSARLDVDIVPAQSCDRPEEHLHLESCRWSGIRVPALRGGEIGPSQRHHVVGVDVALVHAPELGGEVVGEALQTGGGCREGDHPELRLALLPGLRLQVQRDHVRDATTQAVTDYVDRRLRNPRQEAA